MVQHRFAKPARLKRLGSSSLPVSANLEGAAEWSATGPENRGASKARAFDSSTLRHFYLTAPMV